MMKINIQRFGPIKSFSYDLEKNLIVTYGNNNIGKSYAMQLVYLILKTFIGDEGWHFFSDAILMPGGVFAEVSVKPLESCIREFSVQETEVKEISEILKSSVFDTIREIFIPNFVSSCKSTFGNFDMILEQKPEIQLQYRDRIIGIDINNQQLFGEIPLKPVHLKKTKSSRFKSKDYQGHKDIYVRDNIGEEEIEQLADILRGIVWEEVRWLLSSLAYDYRGVYFLPASRSGIYNGMNAFGSIVAELSKKRAYLTKKIELPGISEPISDYFIALSNIKARESVLLEEYYKTIEDEILKGKVTFDKSKNSLIYRSNALNTGLGMTEVSSMVSEISPIVAFLKYIVCQNAYRAETGERILFIEEPEAHLHPNNQIALVEVFAKLSAAGVKLIMSSHSNYVFNKLNNLVLAGDLDYHTYEPIILEDTEEGSVSRSLPIDDLGADDENFGDVSMKLYEEREAIIERMSTEEQFDQDN